MGFGGIQPNNFAGHQTNNIKVFVVHPGSKLHEDLYKEQSTNEYTGPPSHEDIDRLYNSSTYNNTSHAQCGFVTGFMEPNDLTEFLGISNNEEECAILVKEKRPLATGASYRTDR